MERRFEFGRPHLVDRSVLGYGGERPIEHQPVQEPAGLLYAAGPIRNHAWQAPFWSPDRTAVTGEIECVVEGGSVGFVLLHPTENRFTSHEIIVEARTGDQRLLPN